MSVISNQRTQWLAQHIIPCEPQLRAWLLSQRRPAADVDDIIQETYAVLIGLANVDHIHSPRAYMFEVAKTVILQALRKRRVVALDLVADTGALEIPDLTPSPETIAADRRELGRLAALVTALPTRCREAFTLRKVHGLSQQEVAARMGVSENTVEKHIGKSIRLLTAAMGRGGKSTLKASWSGERQKDDHQHDAARNQRRD